MITTDIIIFAKAPQSGLAKTRLIPALGADGAAQLARKMLNHAVAQAVHARLGSVIIASTPDQQHSAFAVLAQQYKISLIDQGSGDLGQRMQNAFESVWQLDAVEPSAPQVATKAATKAAIKASQTKQAKQILLMGSDIPAIDSSMLVLAALALQSGDAVFIPTFDGGYALVGLKSSHPELFLDMQWSNALVMQTTRTRADALGLKCCELAPVHDIDNPADLQHCPF